MTRKSRNRATLTKTEIPNTPLQLKRSQRTRRRPLKIRDEDEDVDPSSDSESAIPLSALRGLLLPPDQSTTTNKNNTPKAGTRKRGRSRKYTTVGKQLEDESGTEDDTVNSKDGKEDGSIPEQRTERTQPKTRERRTRGSYNNEQNISSMENDSVKGRRKRRRIEQGGSGADPESELHRPSDSEEGETPPSAKYKRRRRRKNVISNSDQEMIKDDRPSTEAELNMKDVLKCQACKKKFISQAGLRNHLKCTCPVSKYNQEISKAISMKPLLQLNKLEFLYLARQHGGKLKCPNDNCSKEFKSIGGLQYHAERCGKEMEMKYPCEHCEKRYSSWIGISQHTSKYHTDGNTTPAQTEEPFDPTAKRKAAKKAIEKLHEIIDKGEIQEESSQNEDREFIKEMALTKGISQLFRAPSSYKSTTEDVQLWTTELEQSGYVSCPFCKKTFHGPLKIITVHASSCKKRPGGGCLFSCLQCNSEHRTKRRILIHLRHSHGELVDFVMKEKSKQWEGEEDGDGEEYEEDEQDIDEEGLMESDQGDLMEEDENEKKREHPGRRLLPQGMNPIDLAKDFRKESFSADNESLFEEWKVDSTEWIELLESLAEAYHPRTKESCTFVLEKWTGMKKTTRGKCQTLPLYGSVSAHKGPLVFFVGGPVWAMDWCPLPSHIPHEYAAISCYMDMDHWQFYDQVEPYPGLIQIWDLGELHTRTESPPEMALGIAHDFGYTNAIQWCPSGGYHISSDGSQERPRLGLLGAACSVGCVVIFAVPQPDNQQRRVLYRPNPVAVLKPSTSDHWFGQCLCLDWSRQKGHSKIAAGLGNGGVAIWNICTTSHLLRDGDNHIYPIQLLYVEHSVLSAVSLNPSDDHYLLVVGSDRFASIWDTRNPDCALNDTTYCTGVDCHWPLYHNVGFVSTEKTGASSKGCVVYMLDTGIMQYKSALIPLRDIVWSISSSDWLQCLAAGAEDGKVAMTVYNAEPRIRIHKPRTKVAVATHSILEDKPTVLNKPSEERRLAEHMNLESQKFSLDKRKCREHKNARLRLANSRIELKKNEVQKKFPSCCHSRNPAITQDDTYISQQDCRHHCSCQSRNTAVTQDDTYISQQDCRHLCFCHSRNLAITQDDTYISQQDCRHHSCCHSRNSAEDDTREQGKTDKVDDTREQGKTDKADDTREQGKTDKADGYEDKELKEPGKELEGMRGKDDEMREWTEVRSGPAVARSGSAEARTGYAEVRSGPAEARTGYAEVRSGLVETSSGPTEASSGLGEDRSGLAEASSGLAEVKSAEAMSEPAEAMSESAEVRSGSAEVGSGSAEATELLDQQSSSRDEVNNKSILDRRKSETGSGQLRNQIDNRMLSCRDTLENFIAKLYKKPAKKPSMKKGSVTPKMKVSSKLEEPQEKKPCIEDQDFNISKIVKEDPRDLRMDNIAGKVGEDEDDLSTLKSKLKSWRHGYEHTRAEKCVVYRDYSQNHFISESWKSSTKVLASSDLETTEPVKDYPLNAVTKLVWSPNYRSRQWLLIAGGNGIIRAVQFNCFDTS